MGLLAAFGADVAEAADTAAAEAVVEVSAWVWEGLRGDGWGGGGVGWC